MSERRPYTSDEKVESQGDPVAPHSPATSENQSLSDTHKDINEKTGAPEVHQVSLGDVAELARKVGETQNGLAPVDDLEFVMDKISTLTVDECRVILEQLLKDHEYDYNFLQTQRNKIRALLDGPLENQSNDEWELELKSETAINKFYSPYPEVRAISAPVDDVDMPCETLRAHLLGYCWACIAQFINSLFNSRFPAITFQSQVAQILLYPCGTFLAWVLPDWGFTIGGKRHSLNPGPWSYKEQVLSTIIVDVGLTSAYVFWNIQTQEIYYEDDWLTPAYKILLLLSTQMMGLGFAGMIRRFVVYPTETIWPSILPTLALNRALTVRKEKQETINGWSMSRYKFFTIAFSCMCVYFWLPDYLFQALGYFSWMTWIAPNNFNLAVVTGSQYGLGFNPISSFDWNIFGTYIYPLQSPFFATFQGYIGSLIGGFIILIMYYTNYKWTSYMAPNSAGLYDNTGNSYNKTRVVINGRLDEAAYQAYSPTFYSAANIMLYSAFFAFYPLTMVFMILDNWRPLTRAYRRSLSTMWASGKGLVRGFKNGVTSLAKGHIKEAASHFYHALDGEGSVYDGFDDPFVNMLRNYPEVPDWWFFMIALISFIFAIIILTVYTQLQTPVWTIFFVVGLNLVFLIPMSYLYAIAGTTEGLNVLTELIVGYALPGRPEALMFVKAFGYNINGQADNYISDQKMGFYAKVPPRAMFRGQVFSAFITVFVAYAVVDFVDNDIEGICTPDQPASFNCENGSLVYFSSSMTWGAIGPKRIFNQLYPEMQYAFLVGFLLALVWWTIKRTGSKIRAAAAKALPSGIFKPLNAIIFKPIGLLKHVHPSIVLNGFLMWAPLNLTYQTSGLYMSFAFMYYLKRYKTAWWEKYNFVLSASLTGGVAFMGLIIFFAVQYHPKPVSWWGNDVLATGVDGYASPQFARYTDLPEKGYFGPDSWS